MLIGHSHSMHLYVGLALGFSGTQENLLNMAEVGCLPYFDSLFDSNGTRLEAPNMCKVRMNDALLLADQSPLISKVIMSSNGALGLGKLSNDDLGKIAESMRNTFSRLLAKRKHIVFVVDVPELDFDPKACVDNIRPLRFMQHLNKTPCAISRALNDDIKHVYRSFVFSVLKDFPMLQVFDAAKYLCDNDFCWAMKDDKLLYLDPNHLTVDGSIFIGHKLALEL